MLVHIRPVPFDRLSKQVHIVAVNEVGKLSSISWLARRGGFSQSSSRVLSTLANLSSLLLRTFPDTAARPPGVHVDQEQRVYCRLLGDGVPLLGERETA